MSCVALLIAPQRLTSPHSLYTIYPLTERGQSVDSQLGPAASPGFQADEEVFVIFYFLFLLEEFARSLSSLVREMEQIRVRRSDSERAPARWWWLLQPWRFVGKSSRRAPRKSLLRRFGASLVKCAPRWLTPAPSGLALSRP